MILGGKIELQRKLGKAQSEHKKFTQKVWHIDLGFKFRTLLQ